MLLVHLMVGSLEKSFEVQKIKSGYAFLGVFDERIRQEILEKILKEEPKSFKKSVEFHFGEVHRCNSAGLVEWLKFVQKIAFPFHYSHCPPWLVEQMNVVSQFFPQQISGISSFYAPYFCDEKNENMKILYKMFTDIDPARPMDVRVEKIEKNGLVFLPDFEKEKYFHFLISHKQSFADFFANYKSTIQF